MNIDGKIAISESEKNYIDNCIAEFTLLTEEELFNYEIIIAELGYKLKYQCRDMKVKCLDDNKVYKSIRECAKQYNIPYHGLKSWLDKATKKKPYKGMRFKYL